MLRLLAARTGLLQLPTGMLGAMISTSSEGIAAQAAGAASAQAAPRKAPLMKEFQIYRWNPDSSDKPSYMSYKVDINRCVSQLSAHGARGASRVVSTPA